MQKINMGANIYPYPMPVTLIGATVEGRANFVTVAWMSRANRNPPLFMAAFNKNRYSLAGIRENRTFSINFPDTDLVEKTDYCGLVSGKTTDKSAMFEVFYGELKTAPMIQECSLCIECSLFDVVELPSNLMVLGESVGAYTEERYLTDGKLDVQKMKPVVLTMPDNNYWSVGDRVAEAWSVGKKLK
jgi:flavin reductase (DIM6/NTAB) family NADH-FMN oxidoreductase RutF